MTVLEARKILGSFADSIPDEVIQEDIRIAEVLKNLFFSRYSKLRKLEEKND